MKKIIALLLVLTIPFTLVSCGFLLVDYDKESDLDEQEEEETDKTEDEVTFQTIVAVNNDECAISITGIEEDNIFGYAIEMLLENKSSEKTYTFFIESVYINGVKLPPLLAERVAPLKKSNVSVILLDDDLEDKGVGLYTDIEITFNVYDINDYLADDVAHETVHIYPYGKDNATKYVREVKPSDNVIIDNEFITVIITGYDDDSILGYTINLFLLNKTNKEILFITDEESINGFMMDPYFLYTVAGDRCAFSSICWPKSTLKENDIKEIKEIEFKFRAYELENLLAEDYFNDYIKLNP